MLSSIPYFVHILPSIIRCGGKRVAMGVNKCSPPPPRSSSHSRSSASDTSLAVSSSPAGPRLPASLEVRKSSTARLHLSSVRVPDLPPVLPLPGLLLHLHPQDLLLGLPLRAHLWRGALRSDTTSTMGWPPPAINCFVQIQLRSLVSPLEQLTAMTEALVCTIISVQTSLDTLSSTWKVLGPLLW